MAKVDFLKERAESFLRNANFALKEKRYFAVAFYLEQACQLYLKYYLFLKWKDFPKTHSLKELLEAIGRAYKKGKEIEKIIKNKENFISDLEEASLTARYLPVEFSNSQVKNIKKFVRDLIKFLKKL